LNPAGLSILIFLFAKDDGGGGGGGGAGDETGYHQ